MECYTKNYSIEITDEAMLFELNNIDIQVVEGDPQNRKITW